MLRLLDFCIVYKESPTSEESSFKRYLEIKKIRFYISYI